VRANDADASDRFDSVPPCPVLGSVSAALAVRWTVSIPPHLIHVKRRNILPISASRLRLREWPQ